MTKQILMTDRVQKRKKPTKAFLLSPLGGMLIFSGAIARIVVMMLFAFSSVMPNVIDPVYVMLKGIGAIGGLLSNVLAAVEAVSGICVIVGAVMIHHRPAKAAAWELDSCRLIRELCRDRRFHAWGHSWHRRRGFRADSKAESAKAPLFFMAAKRPTWRPRLRVAF
jgi:hypothetical protein